MNERDSANPTVKTAPAGPLDVNRALAAIWRELPVLARELVAAARYPDYPRNTRFLEHPDAQSEHETRWHQWGIITHSRMFEKYYAEQVPAYLKKWGIAYKVASALAAPVDLTPKSDLIRLAVPLHDLGKFSVRRLTLGPGNDVWTSFKGHELESARIIRGPRVRSILQDTCGLTDAQLDYVAECAARHFVLGTMRNETRRSGEYNLAFVRQPEFSDLCRRLMADNSGYELEVGLLWLADSLAKIELRVEAETDAERAAQEPAVRARLAGLGIESGEMVATALQMPVNIAVAGIYLALWAASR
jgi:hypothetical protein